MRAIFGAHPEVHAPSPVHFLWIMETLVPLLGELGDDEIWESACREVACFFTYSLGGRELDLQAEELRDATERSLYGLLDVAFARLLARTTKRRVFLKENEAYRFFYPLAERLESARFIYLVRDARDVTLSWRESPFHTGGVRLAAETWRDEQRGCLALLSDPRASDKIITVHYERLVAEPESTVRKMCEHVGLDFDPRMLNFHSDSEVRRQSNLVKNWENLSRPIMNNNFERYKKGLGPFAIATVENIAGAELRALGYQLDGIAKPLQLLVAARSSAAPFLGLMRNAAEGRVPGLAEIRTRLRRRGNLERIRERIERERRSAVRQ